MEVQNLLAFPIPVEEVISRVFITLRIRDGDHFTGQINLVQFACKDIYAGLVLRPRRILSSDRHQVLGKNQHLILICSYGIYNLGFDVHDKIVIHQLTNSPHLHHRSRP